MISWSWRVISWSWTVISWSWRVISWSWRAISLRNDEVILRSICKNSNRYAALSIIRALSTGNGDKKVFKSLIMLRCHASGGGSIGSPGSSNEPSICPLEKHSTCREANYTPENQQDNSCLRGGLMRGSCRASEHRTSPVFA